MGFFDSLFGEMESPRKLTSQESFAGILLAASACDGHYSDDESAFANAVDIVLSSGSIETEEKEFIEDLGKLEIDDQRAKTIVKVVVFKNHG